MNLAFLDRAELEAIVLDPPTSVPLQLSCSDAAIEACMRSPVTEREARLRHVLAAAHELLTRVAADAVKGRSIITDPSAMKNFLRVYFAGAERESFVVIYLDAHHRVIEVEEPFAGSLTQTSVYPREIVKRALYFNAAAVCLSHVHPSNSTEPSRADEHVTVAIRQALALVEVRVLDHIIVAADGSSMTSMAERGLV